MNVMEVRTNIRTDKRKDKNYIPVGINAGGIMEFIFVLNVVYVGCKVVAQGGL